MEPANLDHTPLHSPRESRQVNSLDHKNFFFFFSEDGRLAKHAMKSTFRVHGESTVSFHLPGNMF